MEQPKDIIQLLETKQEVSAYFEEVLRFKPMLLVFVRLHKVLYMAMCWQKIRVVVWKKSLTDRELLNRINNTIVNVEPAGFFQLYSVEKPFDLTLYNENPALYIGQRTLDNYLYKSKLIEKYGIKK